MARGRKKQLAVSSKPEDTRKTKVVKGTKENKPETNEAAVCHGQTTMHGFLSPSKTRSPLRHSPLTLLHEENSSSDSNAPKHNFTHGEVRPNLSHPNTTVPLEATSSHSTDEDKPLDTPTVPPPQQNKSHVIKTNMKKPERSDSQRNRKVTDYYPIRRSSRKSKAELKSEELLHIEELIKNHVEEGLEVRHMEGKGRGVFACQEFRKGQFVVEYHGDLMEMAEAKEREATYAQDPTTGCYMYYFQFLTKTYCVDATMETERLGRLINHSKSGNCQTKLHSIGGTPHLFLVASRNIKPGEELLYDYGDRSRDALAAHPWLKY
ncbi:lysine methyltransferase 5Ab [Clupea harengus]|uniref:[histone H4]-lysine(20) N-methyltransferase n=1 Tax=Clupea harengus TaxID=7950 RepID=A0A6P3W3Z4_CLUHA|nr:lysine methyltransferase 5Ab [Clupea harengus]